VHAWKERGARRASGLVAEIVAAHVRPPATDVITHIPPDRDRLLRRGYNPAEQLARELSTGWGALHASLLERTRPSSRQTDLSLVERRRNVRGAFVARRAVPARILLVDDVYTTGSTTSAAAAALRSAGALEVHVVTFARAVR
jgi:ComF family protein